MARKHTDNCGLTGRLRVAGLSCKMDCACWCHKCHALVACALPQGATLIHVVASGQNYYSEWRTATHEYLCIERGVQTHWFRVE